MPESPACATNCALAVPLADINADLIPAPRTRRTKSGAPADEPVRRMASGAAALIRSTACPNCKSVDVPENRQPAGDSVPSVWLAVDAAASPYGVPSLMTHTLVYPRVVLT